MIRLVLALLIWGGAAQADILVVHYDPGGDVGRYANRIAAMHARGDTVEIRGTCLSSCTMYLAVGCVTPKARLGFHGPTVISGPATADLWSRIIASQYPPAIARWYMADARHSRVLRIVTGAELIRLGVAECAEANRNSKQAEVQSGR